MLVASVGKAHYKNMVLVIDRVDLEHLRCVVQHEERGTHSARCLRIGQRDYNYKQLPA
jgi:hypothetical protein